MKKKFTTTRRTLSMLLTLAVTCVSLPGADFDASAAAPDTQETVVLPSNACTVASPSQTTCASFWLDENGTPVYTVSYGDKQVIEASAMGFDLQINGQAVLCDRGFTLTGTSVASQNTTWENPFGDLKTVPDHYEELTLHYETQAGIPIDVICRAYDEGVAFRYSFLQNSEIPEFTISQERTYFNLDDTATAYVHKNRNQTEVEKVPVTSLAAVDQGYFRPMTVIGDGYAMSITEANQVDYTRVHFTVEEGSEPGTLRTLFNGTSDNVDLNADHIKDEVSVDVSESAFDTSWRTFILGDTEGSLVDYSYLVKNLNPPCAIEDTSWITPGMAVRSSLTTEKAKMAIDFAVKHNIDYVHFDAGWYGPEGKMESDPWVCIDGFDLDEISAYADEHNIRLMVYINYRHLEDQYQKGTLDDMFKMYVDTWGIDGIKFGFVPVGSQASTKMVYEWVKIAADNHLIVDIHDEMLPTGYDRTYPNLLTYEAIHGDEENPTPTDDLGYLFTRMTAGQADHTWCFNRSDRNTTKAFRIAASLVYFSPLIFPYWYDDGSLGSINTDGTGLWDVMPTTWDESHMLDSKIEEYASVARRSGEDWYLSAISASDYSLSLPLTMLEEDTQYKAEIYTNSTNDVKKITSLICLVDRSDTLTAQLLSNYGYAVKLSFATPEEIENLPLYSEQTAVSKELMEQIEALPVPSSDNLESVQQTVTYLTSTIDDLDELQKISISNLYKLEETSDAVNRLISAPIASITINGEPLEEFDAATETYTVSLLGGASLPQVSCYPYSESQIVEIKQADSVPGTATVTAKNRFVTKTYTIHFTVPDEAAEIYASDYDDYTTDGRNEFVKDMARDKKNPLALYDENGEVKTFEKGIGTHAATNIYFNIEGKGVSRFQAKCGVSAYNGKETNKVIFKVYKNERKTENLLFDSGDMTQKTPYMTIDVDTTGVSTIILEANTSDDGNSNDHANWCDAKFILGEVFTTPIDEMLTKADTLLAGLTEGTQKELLTAAIVDAQEAKQQENITYQDVYAAAVKLRDVIMSIRLEKKEELQELVSACREKEQDENPSDVWEDFLSAFNDAWRILQDIDASDDDISQAQSALEEKSSLLRESCTLAIACESFVYDGSTSAQPSVKAYTGNGEITYRYYRDSSCTQEMTVPEKGITDAGVYYVIGYAAQTAQYFAAVSDPIEFTIEPKTVKDAAFTGITDLYYNGQPQTLKDLKVPGYVPEQDYTVSYQNNTEIGTATVVISFIGNYTGTVTANFLILKTEPETPDTETPDTETPDTETPDKKEPDNSQTNQKTEDTALKVGRIFQNGKLIYKVTALSGGKKTVSVVGISGKKVASLKIPASVTASGQKFLVTAIGKNAFKNCKKLQKVTIGSNVTVIGKNAFYGDSKLKRIIVKTKKLKTVRKNAFRNIGKKAVIKVPASKRKEYSRRLKKKGQPATVKIK